MVSERFNPMNPLLRVPILGTLLAVLLVFSLTACSSPTPAPASGLAFVVGNRANSAKPDAHALASRIPSTMPTGSVITVTGVDGSPNGVSEPSFSLTDMGNSYDNKDELLGGVARIARELTEARAVSSEADVLGAITSAARGIAGVHGNRRIIISDSMISTASALQFQNNLLSASAAAIANAVPAQLLPNLRGYSVTIVNEGDTAPGQPALSQADRSKLKSIWSRILHRAHVRSISYADTTPPMSNAAKLPAVTAVPLTTVSAISFPTPCTAVVPQSKIEFLGDQASFVSEANATSAIDQVAAALSKCKGKVTVAGTTTDGGGTEAFNQSLSLARATVVTGILAKAMNVSAGSITVQGLGTHFPGFVSDRAPDGSLNKAVAAQNRTVIISVSRS